MFERRTIEKDEKKRNKKKRKQKNKEKIHEDISCGQNKRNVLFFQLLLSITIFWSHFYIIDRSLIVTLTLKFSDLYNENLFEKDAKIPHTLIWHETKI